MIKSFIRNRAQRIARPSFLEGIDRVVQSGLGVTPAQMLEMTNRGIPISPANLGLVYQQGVGNLDFQPPLEYQRGIDMGQLWEAQQDSKRKFKDAIGKIKTNVETK